MKKLLLKLQPSSFQVKRKHESVVVLLINPVTGDTRFELTKMDPVLYNQVSNLKEGEISLPLLDEDRSGLKKYKIIKKYNRFDEHIADYSKDYIRIKELALKEKQLKAIRKMDLRKNCRYLCKY